MRIYYEIKLEYYKNTKKKSKSKVLISKPRYLNIWKIPPFIIVIKPGLARRVDPGPSQPSGWTGSGLSKDRPVQRPG
jgi:hypothetical protein